MCTTIRDVRTSTQLRSKGEKFLKCPRCDQFEWLDLAIAGCKKEKSEPKKLVSEEEAKESSSSKSNSNLKLNIEVQSFQSGLTVWNFCLDPGFGGGASGGLFCFVALAIFGGAPESLFSFSGAWVALEGFVVAFVGIVTVEHAALVLALVLGCDDAG
ncbi:hypothetical protein IFM89_033987 [Coptis chinensis]|uniref:Uncharacterized protein n=1 Tax=Coptis chinensis TaxID=261450 RepID=A0A835IU89_9MAGN|nr:hypothetical protein IFM89_033987 [Coptis chinensis]